MTSDLHSSSCWYKSLSQCIWGSISFMIALLASFEFSLAFVLCSAVCAHLLFPSHPSIPTFSLKCRPPPSLSPPFSFVLKMCFSSRIASFQVFLMFSECLYSWFDLVREPSLLDFLSCVDWYLSAYPLHLCLNFSWMFLPCFVVSSFAVQIILWLVKVLSCGHLLMEPVWIVSATWGC